MKTIGKLTSIILLAWAFQGCEKTATNVDIPVVQPKLVVYSFISPQDTQLVAKVSISKPVFGNRGVSDWVNDATVKLTDGTNTVQLNWDFMYSQYTISASAMPIVAGKTYMLMVSTPDGKSVSASTVVPAAPDANSFKTWFDTSTTVDGFSISAKATASVEWRDNAGEKNYYRAGAVVITQRGSDTVNLSYYRLYNANNTGSDLFTDKDRDGQVLANKGMEFKLFQYSNPPLPSDEKFRGFNFYLLNTDEAYYRYHNSANNNTNGDPFAEPSLVYTNINGGLGCFAAYNQIIKQVKL